MKEFPQCFHVINSTNEAQVTHRLKEYMRVFVYEHVISHEEKEYFSLDEFSRKITETTGMAKPDSALLRRVAEEVEKEVRTMGWKTAFCFGHTGLFIYRNERPPNCWEDSETLS